MEHITNDNRIFFQLSQKQEFQVFISFIIIDSTDAQNFP